MALFQHLSKSNFFVKLRSWEFWPFGIIQAPLFIYVPWLALKARSLFFFSASNPSILMGGMFGESKYDVLTLVPESVKPKTLLQRLPADADSITRRIKAEGLGFPVIFKPDLGERGWMVKRINDEKDIASYLGEIKIDFLIQEFVGLPLEFGVFYIRYPDAADGKVTSVVEKEMLSVTGDGKKNLEQLIFDRARARLHWKTLRVQHLRNLKKVPAKNERVELVSIGNHCLGTKFLNGNALITQRLSASFDKISKQIDGFYFGRFDLRAATHQDLEDGKVQIVELNGCGAEPAHIYDPQFSLWRAIAVLIRHWKDIYIISTQNHLRGVPYLSFQQGKEIYRKFRSLTS